MSNNIQQVEKQYSSTSAVDPFEKNSKTVMNYFKKTGRDIYYESFKHMGSLKRMPDFLIIGTQKGGTSSLYNYLSQHPDTQLPQPKEVHYYDYNYEKGLLWYKNHFPFKWNKKLTGEASPSYLFNPCIVKRVHADLPQVKIVTLFRDPVSRAFSHYKMNVKNGIEPLSFEEAIEKEDERLKENSLNTKGDEYFFSNNFRRYSYIKRGFYDEQLENWLQYYPLDQMLILKSEDLYENSEKVVKQVFEFLGLKTVANGINYANKNKGISGELNETTRIKLNSIFEEHNARLSELTGRTFLW